MSCDHEQESEVEFFGGPYHGMKMFIPDCVDAADMSEISSPEMVELVEKDKLPEDFIIMRYTRVYNRRQPTNQFEYIGRVLL